MYLQAPATVSAEEIFGRSYQVATTIPDPALHHRRPQTVGGFKKCFEEQAQAHEKALRTPNSTLFGSQDGRQDLGKADTPSNTNADLKKALRTPDSTQFGEKEN